MINNLVIYALIASMGVGMATYYKKFHIAEEQRKQLSHQLTAVLTKVKNRESVEYKYYNKLRKEQINHEAINNKEMQELRNSDDKYCQEFLNRPLPDCLIKQLHFYEQKSDDI